MREREDTIPGYFGARSELNAILKTSIIPYEKQRIELGETKNIPLQIALQLDSRRNAILAKSQTDRAKKT